MNTPGDRAPPRRTLIGVLAAGSLVPLNSTMIAVALPEIAADFDIAPGAAGLLVTVYLLTMLIGQPLSGRLTDRVGARRAVSVALLGVAGASVVGAVAGSFPLLVGARLVQAVFASALSPGVQSILRAMTEATNRGRRFGLFGSAAGAGAASGPVIGGAVVAMFGWHAVFLVNLPLVLFVLVTLRDYSAPTPVRRQEVAMERGNESLVGATFRTAYAIQALTTLTQYTLLLVVPVLLAARRWGSSSTGLALSALTAGVIVAGPIGGRLGDRRGRRYPVSIGLSVASLAASTLAVSGEGVGSVLLVSCLAVVGLGLGAATPSVVTSALESVPEQRTAAAAGLLGTGRYVGSIPASLLVAAILSGGVTGVNAMFALAALSVIIATMASTRLPSVRPPTLQH